MKNVRAGELPQPLTDDPLLKAKVFAMTTVLIEKIAKNMKTFIAPTNLSGDLLADVSRTRDLYMTHLLSMTNRIAVLPETDKPFLTVYENLLSDYAYSKRIDRLSQPENMISSGIGTAVDAVCNGFSIAVTLFQQKYNRKATDTEIVELVNDVKRVLKIAAKLDVSTFVRSFRGILDEADASEAIDPQDRLISTNTKFLDIKSLAFADAQSLSQKIGCPINFGGISEDGKDKVMLFETLLDPLFETLITVYKNSQPISLKEHIAQET